MTYELRRATDSDIDWMVYEAGYKMIHEELRKPELYNVESITELSQRCVSEGTVLIVTKDEEPIGVLGAIMVPHYLNADLNTLVEIMWYVDKENRNGRAGAMLIKSFAELAKIKGVNATLSLLSTSSVSDRTLEKYGFKLTERNYLMEI